MKDDPNRLSAHNKRMGWRKQVGWKCTKYIWNKEEGERERRKKISYNISDRISPRNIDEIYIWAIECGISSKNENRTDCAAQNDDADLQNKYLLNNLKSKKKQIDIVAKHMVCVSHSFAE